VRSDLQLERDALQLEYSACSAIDDCADSVVGSDCDQSCGAAVSFQANDAYNRHMGQLEQAYCKGQSVWYRECGINRPTCSATFPICDTFAGHCVALDSLVTPCSLRPLDQCATDGLCVVASGRAFDAAGRCFSAQTEAIRCVDRAVPPAGASRRRLKPSAAWTVPSNARMSQLLPSTALAIATFSETASRTA
jgi:hypothetical protein